MWKPRVVQLRGSGRWKMVGGVPRRTWGEAFEDARRAFARMAGREVPC